MVTPTQRATEWPLTPARPFDKLRDRRLTQSTPPFDEPRDRRPGTGLLN